MFAGQEQTELGVGNQMLLSPRQATCQCPRRAGPQRHRHFRSDRAAGSWDLFDAAANAARTCPHFSVEMETGTGKTYVYLRTIFELSRRYGFQKFIIVVPSVAIREGVLKNIEITAEHFRALYNNLPFEHFVYDAKKVNRLRQFAVSNTLQILIINIDAFRKNFTGTEAEQKSNVIYKESDKLSGRQPIEFVQAARPIVIIDEPQSVDSTDKAQEAIRALNPLCTLRYSATHRNPYNLVYRLDPVRAFELRLVKQIVVASAAAEGGANDAFVRVEQIDYKKGIKAKLRIHAQTPEGPKEKSVHGQERRGPVPALRRTRGRTRTASSSPRSTPSPATNISASTTAASCAWARNPAGCATTYGGRRSSTPSRSTWKRSFSFAARGIKVLSLFFIDRVANYRDYDGAGQPVKGKFAEAFEACLAEFAKDAALRSRSTGSSCRSSSLHNGYFAQDKKGVLKDTRGDTQADDEVYNLIMKEKERLLSEDEPLRFIFSHSALREGWDNPNVFQICTLNETRSAMKKRQEIGRGLRLPVDQNGQRVFDESVNKLLVMANESYEDFARALQTEYEEDCGVTFGKVPLTAIARITRVVDGEEQPIGREAAERIREALVQQKMLDADGRIQPAFDPKKPGFKIDLPEGAGGPGAGGRSICWPRTRSSATSGRTRTREPTGSRRKCSSAPSSRRFGTGSSRKRRIAWNSRPRRWSAGPWTPSSAWRRSRRRRSASASGSLT